MGNPALKMKPETRNPNSASCISEAMIKAFKNLLRKSEHGAVMKLPNFQDPSGISSYHLQSDDARKTEKHLISFANSMVEIANHHELSEMRSLLSESVLLTCENSYQHRELKDIVFGHPEKTRFSGQ
ncbi:hypothetical protein JXA56_03760 [Candidatus Micrarchaeota archaeon]|nr:hypothetical protein [Candidatus Micrarchaeota archaeon]